MCCKNAVMKSLAGILSDIVGAAFVAEDLPEELGAVRVSDRPDLAQFQCNGAMAAAKIAKQNPRGVAEKIAVRLQGDDVISSVEVAGPGFININLNNDYISKYLSEYSQKDGGVFDPVGAGRTVVLDYGGPNVAKAMHVGHLRSSIIGDSLRRMYLAAGYNAVGDVHMGDWGLPMGQVISELKIRHPEWVYFDAQYDGKYPKESPVTMEDLAEIYPKASAACKEDEDRLAMAREITAQLQDGHAGYRALWRHFVDVSIAGMKENFSALGVSFDLWLGESDVHDRIAPMVERLRGENIAEESDGAVVVNVAVEGDSKEVPPLILLKSDGGVMYGTTDLATVEDRVETHSPEAIIYIVDQRQGLHFEQVFRAAEKAGYVQDGLPKCVHAGFGTMNGTDGKPFKTRAGGVMKLEDLIGMALEKAQARLDEAELAQDMPEEARAEIAHKIGVAAIKFADLQNNRISDYVFDLDRMTALEGKTGPYLLYQVVRIKSLLRKAAEQGASIGAHIEVSDSDLELCLILAELPDQFRLALENHTPHVLCDYVYRLAQAFSSFYGRCHILGEADEQKRGSWLLLSDLTARTIEQALDLLGISVPERM
jgi:arginyl-tRNA synthetase